MSVIKLRNVSNTNFIFPEIGPTDDRGVVRGKKVGCVPGSNILVTNEDEIGKSGLLQQLIASRKLVPLQQKENAAPTVVNTNAKKTSQQNAIEDLVQQIPEEYDDESDILPEDSINLISGDEEDAKELQAYLNSQQRIEAVKAKNVVTQQPLSRPDKDLKASAEVNQPDPKGANGTDLFYERVVRDIIVDDPRPASDLYTDYSVKKN